MARVPTHLDAWAPVSKKLPKSFPSKNVAKPCLNPKNAFTCPPATNAAVSYPTAVSASARVSALSGTVYVR